MKAIARTASAFCLLLVSTVFAIAQEYAPAAPQTPRQALIEMINGGPQSVIKHLTIEDLQLLNQPENKQSLAEISTIGSVKGELGKNLQFFETGPVLLSFVAPAEDATSQPKKIEVHVDSEDPSGGEDSFEFSVHSYQNGEEIEEEWAPFFSHVTMSLVQQEGIWRLSKVGVGIELSIGDPEFLKKTFLKDNRKATGIGVVAPSKTGEETQAADLPPDQLVRMLGYAESAFARTHPDTGFTCSLADLSGGTPMWGVDPQQLGGGTYKGYKINLASCQGKPAGSYQVSVEPIGGGGTGKAYCSDATQNLRVSDDGRASTCLIAGRSASTAVVNQDDSAGIDESGSIPKPKEQP